MSTDRSRLALHEDKRELEERIAEATATLDQLRAEHRMIEGALKRLNGKPAKQAAKDATFTPPRGERDVNEDNRA
jgi:cell division protein FtsB